MPVLERVYIPRKLFKKLIKEKSPDGIIAKGLELYFKVKNAKKESKISRLEKIKKFFSGKHL
ncbi:MAG: hypothetical protein ACTSUF_03690 [Candidatus Heimdallarchaeaceae archaeon]